MNILLTNDDGYRADGINILKKYLLRFGRVIIVAPENNQSTTSHSISLNRPLRCKKIKKDIYSVSGLPADCVNFAINSDKIHEKFHLVISGINDGANVGDDINYSGVNWTNIDPNTWFGTDCNNACSNTSSISELNNVPKQLIKIVDVLGRETPFKPNTPLLYIYNNGTVERKMIIE